MITGITYTVEAVLVDGQRAYIPDPDRYNLETAKAFADALFDSNSDVKTITVTRSTVQFTPPMGCNRLNPSVVYSRTR